MKSTADSTKTKVPLNISWSSDHQIWHIMILSDYIQAGKQTLIASCKSHIKFTQGDGRVLHRDWLDKPFYKFPTRENKYPDLNFKNVCSTCVSKTNIEDFKIWLITQKLKHL